MKKRILLLLSLVLLGGAISFAWRPVPLQVRIDDLSSTGPGHAKAPVLAPSVSLDGHQLELQSFHPDYIINIVQDGEVVYTVAVPADVTSVTLPSWLSGEYELQLIPDGSTYYFFGTINL